VLDSTDAILYQLTKAAEFYDDQVHSLEESWVEWRQQFVEELYDEIDLEDESDEAKLEFVQETNTFFQDLRMKYQEYYQDSTGGLYELDGKILPEGKSPAQLKDYFGPDIFDKTEWDLYNEDLALDEPSDIEMPPLNPEVKSLNIIFGVSEKESSDHQ